MSIPKIYQIEVICFDRKTNNFKMSCEIALITSLDVESDEFMEQLYLEEEVFRMYNLTVHAMDLTPIGEKKNMFKMVIN